MQPTERILLIDDSAHDRALTLEAINETGVEVEAVEVGSGDEAFDYVLGTGAYTGRDIGVVPRLVLLDSRMHGVSGLEVLRTLRADERTKTLPVVMWSSSDDPHDATECYRVGANSYIPKPTNYDEFRRAIRQIVAYWVELNFVPETH